MCERYTLHLKYIQDVLLHLVKFFSSEDASKHVIINRITTCRQVWDFFFTLPSIKVQQTKIQPLGKIKDRNACLREAGPKIITIRHRVSVHVRTKFHAKPSKSGRDSSQKAVSRPVRSLQRCWRLCLQHHIRYM